MRRLGIIPDLVVERVVKVIAEAIHPQKIILFGSRAKGVRPDSDVDLVVIYAGEKSKRQVKLDIHRLMEPVSVPMDLFVLSPEELQRQRHVANTLAREVAERGVTVYG
jgi:predicted nucleotidyltransferase